MRKLFLKAFVYLACVAWSGVAGAVGFGGINVTSALGQPLVAEIELVAVDPSDKASLGARLASVDAFKGAGIDYPYALPKMKFSVESRASGEFYIKATSAQPVNEPFVSLLIELTWSSGRLLREYTFLLDPPGFVAEQPAVAAVKPIDPVIMAPVVVAPVVAAPVAASSPVATPEPQIEPVVAAASAPAVAEAPQAMAAASAPAAETAAPVEPAPTPEPLPVKEETKTPPAAAKEVAHTAGAVTTKRGDTLSKIATASKSSDVSLERMLVALYRANAEAFDGNNMNRLRVGKILRQPQDAELEKLPQTEAANEVRAQVADWNAYRQQLAGASAPAVDRHAKQEVSGKISSAVVDKTPAAKESAKEVLKLSKGDAPGDQTAAGGKGKSAKEKANAKEEDAVAKAKALKEAEERTALLEKNIKDMQRLVELKNQAAAKVTQAASAPTSAVASASAVAVAKPKPVVKVVEAPSLLDDILENPILLGGGAAALLGLGGFAFMRIRQSKAGGKQAKETEDIGSATGRITAPVAPSPETGDFTDQFASTQQAGEDEVDPVGEAEMFLNFGRDVQAEEVLKDALNKNPANNAVKLKLLSIYATRKDTKSFYVYAMEIKESGDVAAWGQAAAMGQGLEPGNPAYGGAEPVVAEPVADEAALPAVDFDLGLTDNEAAQASTTVDLHGAMGSMPVGDQTSIMSVAEIQAAQEAPMDFDVTSTNPGFKVALEKDPVLDVTAMDFDITGSHPGIKEEAPKLDMSPMDFDASVSQAQATPVAVESAPSLNLDDLVFETPAKPAAPEPIVAAVADFDPGLAFSIDIPTESKTEEIAKPAAPTQSVGLGEISLSLDDVPAPASAAVKDERWQEVATKLDLAKAYQEMGDQAGAREILEEVVRDGDEQQRATATELLQKLA